MRTAVHSPVHGPAAAAAESSPRLERASLGGGAGAGQGHSLARLSVQPQSPNAAPIQAAGLFSRLKASVQESKLYKGASALKSKATAFSKTPGFQKARAIAGVLGIAGGYKQGYGTPGDEMRGSEARGAFRDKWEGYFSSLPEEQQAAARRKFSLPEPAAPGPSSPSPVPSGGSDHGPEEIEMQDMSNLPPRSNEEPSERRVLGGIETPPNSFESE